MNRGLGAMLLALATACSTPKEETVGQWPTLDGRPPLVIAHRGASGYLPEHTLAAYKLAVDQGADVVEPDLVFTKDGVLVARHDRHLSTTTDVADRPEFAGRKRANNDPADTAREDWWVEDFTLAELKSLRARQPFPGRSTEFDGLYEIPTFDEVLALVSEEAAKAGRPVGVYPETKHPAFFASIGMDFEAPLLGALEGFDAGPVFIQSFDPEILKRLKGKTNAKLVQLVYEETLGAGPNIPLGEIPKYADGVGPAKELILRADGMDSSVVTDAHEGGLFIHPWTFRDDKPGSLVSSNRGRRTYTIKVEPTLLIKLELEEVFKMGVDGVFTDFPDTAVRARDSIDKE